MVMSTVYWLKSQSLLYDYNNEVTFQNASFPFYPFLRNTETYWISSNQIKLFENDYSWFRVGWVGNIHKALVLHTFYRY